MRTRRLPFIGFYCCNPSGRPQRAPGIFSSIYDPAICFAVKTFQSRLASGRYAGPCLGPSLSPVVLIKGSLSPVVPTKMSTSFMTKTAILTRKWPFLPTLCRYRPHPRNRPRPACRRMFLPHHGVLYRLYTLSWSVILLSSSSLFLSKLAS